MFKIIHIFSLFVNTGCPISREAKQEEVAKYLRLPKETIERQAAQGKIPGRRIEESWRFLKKAIDHWLQSHDSRDILLYQAGSLADDETLDELLASIYAQRVRPEIETEQGV